MLRKTYLFSNSHVKHHSSYLLLLILSLLYAFQPFNIHAQETLMALTSNGGTEGKGTVFTFKTNATAFTIVKALPDWGKNLASTSNGNVVKGNDGNFYGMTYFGGTFNFGTIYKITPAGTLTLLRHFNSLTDGANPCGSLTLGTDGNFYGLTSSGGTSSYGTIFKITPAGVFTVLRHLGIAADGGNPQGSLVLGNDGNFYGITRRGGSTGYGTIFKVTPSGTYTVLRSLANATDGGTCYGSLAKGSDGNFYGITSSGGSFTNGTVFKITPAGTYTVLRNMKSTTDGSSNANSLVGAADGFLYGLCYYGGTSGQGTIFKISTTGTFSVLRNLTFPVDGANPRGALLVGTDGNLYGMTSGGGANSGGTIFKISTTGTFSVLRALTVATDGGRPAGALFNGGDGNYYGMTMDGGSNLYGTIFKISPAGTFTVLTRLNGGIVGNSPNESLIQGTDYAYYGTTINGGTNDQGTVFKICGGLHTVIHSFKSTTEGGFPAGSLVQASDGNLYGVTTKGGTSNAGTIFKITPAGTFTVLRQLVSTTDGSFMQGSLIQGADNYLYGMATGGGSTGSGTIFKISTTGTYKVIRHLNNTTDGAGPEGNLVKGAGGVDSFFYGMTKTKIFKISPNGILFSVLRTLNPSTDGINPLGSLVKATDGNFYGTNSSGGTMLNSGTIFKITPAGVYTVLRNLNPTTDGATPKGNLIQAADGFLYGMTSDKGTNKAGTIFKISTAGAFTVLRHFNLLADGGTPFGSFVIQKTLPLVANPQTTSTAEDVAKALTLTGSGGSPLTFKISTLPKHGTVTGSTASRTYTPAANYNGKDSFYFTANVGCIASAPAKVLITVTPVNDAPVLTTIGNKTVKKGVLLTFTATATDVDAGQTKAYSLITPPAGATIVATTGVFKWTPSAVGTFTFKVRVTDNGSPVLFDEEQITVSVTAAPLQLPISKAINQDEKGLTKIAFYPNPVSNILIVTLGRSEEKVSGTITNADGITVKRFAFEKITRFDLNVSNLSAGIYLLHLKRYNKTWLYKFLKM